MDIYQFEKVAGKKITRFGSDFNMAKIVDAQGSIHIGMMFLGENGLIGEHEAVVPQLFLVIQGEGWVYGAGKERMKITAGEAAFWHKGESHSSGTESGLTALVIESDALDPQAIMAKLKIKE
ncbi:hypothetical protein EV207_11950 [Scopulibacillus darangshiensis]|uniref:Cupin domain n=1 Tax=Scopulibacillus darangshiensis TaxID=442528 RepID=A0A4R2NWQ6_9BACL|nr:cupin [Scopulibacillus darangshiensis]TCP26619.1 hypothetical protein EV207_11950 [Scopulibacillus darangshiensis]